MLPKKGTISKEKGVSSNHPFLKGLPIDLDTEFFTQHCHHLTCGFLWYLENYGKISSISVTKRNPGKKKTSKTSHLSNLISTRLFWPHLQLLVTRHPHYLHPARPQGQCPQIWGENTVDGRSPAPVGMVNIPLFTRFYTSQVV